MRVYFKKLESKRTYWVAVISVFLLSLPATLSAVTVEAALGSAEIPVGGYTFFTITVEGSTRADVQLPKVGGLILRDSGTSQSTSIINGKITKSAVIRITVQGDEEGTYTIPSFPVIVKEEEFKTEPVSISVTNTPSQNSSSNATSGNSTQGTDQITAEDIQKISHIEIETSMKPVYVGQKVPISIELWINTAHRFDNLSAPVINNDHLLMETLGQDYERTIQYDGTERYEVYTWDASFTALKAGMTTIEAETEVTVLVRARKRTSTLNSIFDSDFFSPSYRRIPLLIKAKEVKLDIRSIPTEQPLGFSGAVGQFELNVTASPTSLSVGDPITLDVKITGTGNFDRVFHEGLGEHEGFKTYSPETQFEANESNSLKGIKTFKQAIIPQDAELTEIPSIQFVYFDTDAAQFKTLTNAPIPILLSESAISNNSDSQTTSRSPTSGLKVLESDGWIPIQLDLDEPVTSLKPYIQMSTTWIVLATTPSILLLLSFAIPLLLTKSRQNRQLQMNELRKTLKPIEKALSTAISNNESGAFIQGATDYSREILGVLWSVAPPSITPADAKNRLDDTFPRIKEILKLNDSMHYAGGQAPEIDTKTIHKELEIEWKELISSIEKS